MLIALETVLKLKKKEQTPAPAQKQKAQNTGKNQTPKTRPADKRPPSRQGKKSIGGFFDPAVAKQLKMLGVTEGRSTQALLGEALNLLFEKHGKDAIADDGKEGT